MMYFPIDSHKVLFNFYRHPCKRKLSTQSVLIDIFGTSERYTQQVILSALVVSAARAPPATKEAIGGTVVSVERIYAANYALCNIGFSIVRRAGSSKATFSNGVALMTASLKFKSERIIIEVLDSAVYAP